MHETTGRQTGPTGGLVRRAMAPDKLHPDEVDADADLAHRLVAGQFPQWADLPVLAIETLGTDHTIYRLGDHLSVRLPRIERTRGQIDTEATWLPQLAPLLPVPIPVPVAVGEPAEGYPWRWAVCPWLPGETAEPERLTDPDGLARSLGELVRAFGAIDLAGGPAPGPTNAGRGVPLVDRDAMTRWALDRGEGLLDVAAATAAWEADSAAASWTGPPTWLHGDIQAGNLLLDDGHLTALIDFGCMGVGDPAVDLMVAWTLLPASSRATFRDASGADDDTWRRGRAWALSTALVALPYYLDSNPVMTRQSRRTIEAVLGEH